MADKAKTKKKYWYEYFHSHCPVCLREDCYKVRRYTKRPKYDYQRHHHEQSYDWCDIDLG